MIASKQIAFGKAAGGNKLPDGVVPIEYLESTGTQWIDTGVIWQLTDSIEALLGITQAPTQANRYVFGSRIKLDSGYSYLGLMCQQNALTARVQPGNYALGNFTDSLQLLRYRFGTSGNSGDFSFGGGTSNRDYPSTATPPEISMFLFACSDETGGRFGEISGARIGGFSVTRNGILILDLIPVRVGNIGYMYDRVSGQLFGNQGTGEFVLGPDIIDYTAKDYVQDGLVAMWDGIENAGWGKHITGATQWVDLISGCVMTVKNRFITTDIDFRCDKESERVNQVDTATTEGATFYDAYNQGDSTVEVVFGDNIDSSQTSAVFGIRTQSNMFGRGQVSGTARSVFLRSAVKVYTPVNAMTYAAGPGLWNTSSVIIKNGQLFGWLNNNEILPSSTPPAADGEGSSFSVNRANAYRVIRVYSRALTAEEIAHNYSIDKARFGL